MISARSLKNKELGNIAKLLIYLDLTKCCEDSS